MLWWIRALLAISLRECLTYKNLPFTLADLPKIPRKETYLGICVRDILPDSLRALLELKEVLQEKGQVSGLIGDSYLTVTIIDGGELGFALAVLTIKSSRGRGPWYCEDSRSKYLLFYILRRTY